MTCMRWMVPLLLLAFTLAGCPLHAKWHKWHGHHGHDDDAPAACETSADCDDGRSETLDVCTTEGVCDARMVSYAGEVQAIFQTKCAGCHVDSGSGSCAGGTCLASSYAAVSQPSNTCAGLTVAECAQVRILNGSMPRGRGCTGDPELDAANASCLTAAELATLDAWIAAGWPETP